MKKAGMDECIGCAAPKEETTKFCAWCQSKLCPACYAKTCQITCLPIIQASQAKVRGSIMAGAEL